MVPSESVSMTPLLASPSRVSFIRNAWAASSLWDIDSLNTIVITFDHVVIGEYKLYSPGMKWKGDSIFQKKKWK